MTVGARQPRRGRAGAGEWPDLGEVSWQRPWGAAQITFPVVASRNEPRQMWIIGTVVTVGAALAGFMYALVSGTHRRFGEVNKRIDDVRVDLQRLHDDHDRFEARLRAVGA